MSKKSLKSTSGSKKSRITQEILSERVEANKNEMPQEIEFNELIYEDINDDFAYGMFGPFKLIMDKKLVILM